jgi:hypothetical protein
MLGCQVTRSLLYITFLFQRFYASAYIFTITYLFFLEVCLLRKEENAKMHEMLLIKDGDVN